MSLVVVTVMLGMVQLSVKKAGHTPTLNLNGGKHKVSNIMETYDKIMRSTLTLIVSIQVIRCKTIVSVFP